MRKPTFKIGDKVKFIDSGKRFKSNKNREAFYTLAIPDWTFRVAGTILGYYHRHPWLAAFGFDKTKVIVHFDTPKFNSFYELTIWQISGHQTRFLVPDALLKPFETEPNHPLTKIFV